MRKRYMNVNKPPKSMGSSSCHGGYNILRVMSRSYSVKPEHTNNYRKMHGNPLRRRKWQKFYRKVYDTSLTKYEWKRVY